MDTRYRTNWKTLYSLAKGSKKIGSADANLQRKKGCWSSKRSVEWLLTAVGGRNYAPIYTVDLSSCLEYSTRLEEQLADELTRLQLEDKLGARIKSQAKLRAQAKELSLGIGEFKKRMERGQTHLILEGGNRHRTMLDFFNGELQLPKGTEIPLATGSVFLPKAMSYDEITDSKFEFEGRLVGSACEQYLSQLNCLDIEIQSETWADLEKDFVNINDGVPLNSMEKLWVKTTPFSSVLRPMLTSVSKEWLQNYGKSANIDISRRDEALLMSQLAMLLKYGLGCDTKKADVRLFWQKDEEVTEKEKHLLERLQENILHANFDKIISESNLGGKQLPKWLSTSFLYSILHLTDLGLSIRFDNRDECCELIYGTATKLYSDSKARYAKDLNDFSSGDVEVEPRESQYPHWLITNSDVGSARKKFLDEFLPLLDEKVQERKHLFSKAA